MTAHHSLTIALALTGMLASGPALAQGPPPVAPPPPLAPVAPPPAPLLAVGALLQDFTIPSMDVEALTEAALAARMTSIEAMETARLLSAGVHVAETHAADLAYGFQSSAQTAEARAAAALRRERDRETRAYEEAYRHLNESRWERAITRFSDVIAMKGTRADAALYWKAYAQDRQGQRAEALATLTTLTRDFPNSRYLQQARALEAEVRRNAGQPVSPEAQADEELKLMAIASLQHQAPEQAVPMLETLLAGPASPKLKERALFVLAQSNSPQAREILKGIAKGNSTPELQSRAISYLGLHGGRESRAVLAEVYSSTSDVDVKKRILRGYMVGGEKDRLVAAAQSEQNPELRAEAVRQLGVMNARTELQQLYAKETNVDIKKQIIQAMFVGGSAAQMIELAKTEQNPELRRAAIRNLGLMGSKGTGETLVEIYRSDATPEVKKAVIHALFLQNNATALVSIARGEKDMAMQKELVQRLSHINSPVAREYLLEILNK